MFKRFMKKAANKSKPQKKAPAKKATAKLTPAKKTSVYTMKNKDKETLYVGMSRDPKKRAEQHAKKKDWYPEVAKNQGEDLLDLADYPWVLDTHRYHDLSHLMSTLENQVLAPAEPKAREL